MRLTTYILLIISLISTKCYSQSAWKTDWLKQDKAEHIICSMGITLVGTELAKELKMKNPELAGAGLSLAVGLAKEFLMDEAPSPYDITADLVGISIAIPLNRGLQKWDKKRYKKLKE